MAQYWTFYAYQRQTKYLLNFLDPPIDTVLQLVEECGVLHFVAEVCNAGLPALVRSPNVQWEIQEHQTKLMVE